MHRRAMVAHLSVLATFTSVLLTSPASAQYFGANKVQYRHLQFQTLKTEHFDVYFTDSDASAINAAARMAERWHERLSRILLHRLIDRQPLILYSSHPEFEQTNVVPELLDEATGGFTEPEKRRIVLPMAGPLADTDHVIGHELVHALQFDMTAGLGNGMNRLPTWFVEGLAEYCSIGPADAVTAMWLRDAAQRDALPSIDQLDDPTYFPYRWGHAFWAYVAGRWGDGIIRRLFVVASESGVRGALESVLGRSPQELTREWHAAIIRAYAPALSATATRTGRRVPLGTKPERSELNVGPAISPDGRLIAFLSGRNLFSIDLYVAEAATGRIVRKLTNTASSPHFSSLQFIHSAGAWDADGRRLAVAAMTGGRAALAIFDASTWRQARDVVIPGVDEIFGPSWSPAGDRICFTAMTRGVTDLYAYDLRHAVLRRLTNDVFADLQPAWSPDGRSIAFATDRYTTRLDTVATGRYRLALLDVESGDVRPMASSAAGDDLNPQWTPDGRAIAFVSNRTGIANVYRTAVDADGSGEDEQLTNVVTGVSGITGTSPAMSVASQRGVVAFSVFENGVYGVHVIDPAQQTPVGNAALQATLALPPVDRKPSDVASLVQNTTLGLPRDLNYAVSRHNSSLSLEGVGGAALSAGANPFGVVAQGALVFSFADVLGDRHLATAVQAGNGLLHGFTATDLAAQVAYVDQRRRWNWGTSIGQLPFISGGVRVDNGVMTSQGPVAVTQTVLFRRLDQSAEIVTAYPFNRAARFEVAGRVARLAFDRLTETTVNSLTGAGVLEQRVDSTSLAPPLVTGTAAAALVFDATNVGAISPVHGQRYRLEAAPTTGTIDYVNVLADYRRYFMPAPFYTIALRALHSGRYGSGAEDSRLVPFYVGHPSLVRGYDIVPLDLGECAHNAFVGCQASDRLMGSRALVGNLEFRMPLLRPLGLTRRMYSPLPTELALFADGGTAWNRGERPSFLGGSRTPAASAGLTVRTNLRGFAIAAFTIARPLVGRDRDWIFQFNLAPGF